MIVIKSFLILFFLLAAYYPSLVLAQEASSTATVSADIKAKLKALQEEIASKASLLKAEMSKKLQNKAYLGTISSKEETTFSLNIKKGERKVEIKDYTDFLGANLPAGRQGKVTFKNLAVDDFVIVLGDVDDKEVLLAKRIIKTQALKIDEKKIMFGKIASVNKTTVTVLNKEDQQINFNYDTKTKIKLSGKDGTSKDIKVGQNIIAVLLTLKDGSLKARFVYLIPDPSLITPTLSPNASPTPKSKLN